MVEGGEPCWSHRRHRRSLLVPPWRNAGRNWPVVAWRSFFCLCEKEWVWGYLVPGCRGGRLGSAGAGGDLWLLWLLGLEVGWAGTRGFLKVPGPDEKNMVFKTGGVSGPPPESRLAEDLFFFFIAVFHICETFCQSHLPLLTNNPGTCLKTLTRNYPCLQELNFPMWEMTSADRTDSKGGGQGTWPGEIEEPSVSLRLQPLIWSAKQWWSSSCLKCTHFANVNWGNIRVFHLKNWNTNKRMWARRSAGQE